MVFGCVEHSVEHALELLLQMLTFDGAYKVKIKNRKGLNVRLIVSLRMKMDFYRHATSCVARNT